jgi:hypothetical protein
MDETEVAAWFAGYLAAFAALGRGEVQPVYVLAYYGVPFLVTTDDVVVSLATATEVAAWLQNQADAMVAARYDHTATRASDLEILNVRTALHRAELSRQRADNSEINGMVITYLITRESEGHRISALILHSP